MKSTRKIIIYISMLVLCMSFMAYGVYSAMTASLTISGSLGFNPHNCQGTAQIVSVDNALNADGTTFVVSSEDKDNIVAWESGTTLTISDEMYFDDISTRDPGTGAYIDANVKIKPIVITLKMTNTSAFAVQAKEKTANLQTATQTPTNITGVTYSYSTLSLASGATENEFKVTITPTLTEQLEVTAFALTIDIAKNI